TSHSGLFTFIKSALNAGCTPLPHAADTEIVNQSSARYCICPIPFSSPSTMHSADAISRCNSVALRTYALPPWRLCLSPGLGILLLSWESAVFAAPATSDLEQPKKVDTWRATGARLSIAYLNDATVSSGFSEKFLLCEASLKTDQFNMTHRRWM